MRLCEGVVFVFAVNFIANVGDSPNFTDQSKTVADRIEQTLSAESANVGSHFFDCTAFPGNSIEF
jgi:hypothetical protein